jgi:hypothetical protein
LHRAAVEEVTDVIEGHEDHDKTANGVDTCQARAWTSFGSH